MLKMLLYECFYIVLQEKYVILPQDTREHRVHLLHSTYILVDFNSFRLIPT